MMKNKDPGEQLPRTWAHVDRIGYFGDISMTGEFLDGI